VKLLSLESDNSLVNTISVIIDVQQVLSSFVQADLRTPNNPKYLYTITW